ncbi:MAG: response regulator [Candidatus Promineifilaceae bacterium]|jgi:NarL family two-component system response regulator LiaR
MDNLIRVLIADDHPVVRQGLSALLIPRNGMKVIGEAVNGNQAVDLACELNPDVIMMDMVMPGLTGSEATAEIIARKPDAQILILTSFSEDENLIKAINAGALGCLLKDSQPDDLLHAIRSVNRGQMSMPHNLAAKLLNQPAKETQTESVLTDREQEIATLIAQGLSNKEIAQELVLSSNTIRSHVSNILRKLKLSNRTQIAIYFKDDANLGE